MILLQVVTETKKTPVPPKIKTQTVSVMRIVIFPWECLCSHEDAIQYGESGTLSHRGGGRKLLSVAGQSHRLHRQLRRCTSSRLFSAVRRHLQFPSGPLGVLLFFASA